MELENSKLEDAKSSALMWSLSSYSGREASLGGHGRAIKITSEIEILHALLEGQMYSMLKSLSSGNVEVFVWKLAESNVWFFFKWVIGNFNNFHR